MDEMSDYPLECCRYDDYLLNDTSIETVLAENHVETHKQKSKRKNKMLNKLDHKTKFKLHPRYVLG